MARIGWTGSDLADLTRPAFGTVTRLRATRFAARTAVEAAHPAAAVAVGVNALVHVFTLHGVGDHIHPLTIDLQSIIKEKKTNKEISFSFLPIGCPADYFQ